MFKHLAVVGSLLMFVGGCSSSGVDGPVDAGGHGTETLQVVASIRVVGNGDAEDLNVTASVAVIDASQVPASAAEVMLHWPLGMVGLVEAPAGTGVFQLPAGAAVPWADAYGLSVRRGADEVSGVSLAVPELHVISSPAPYYTHFAGQPLDVQWTGARNAPEFRVYTTANGFDTGYLSGDPGTYRVEGVNFAAQAGSYVEAVGVWRRKTIDLSGTLPNSTFTLEIRQEVAPVAVNPPANP